MKVLHLIPYMHPSAGGPPVVVDRFCDQLAQRGWDVEVLTTNSYNAKTRAAVRVAAVRLQKKLAAAGYESVLKTWKLIDCDWPECPIWANVKKRPLHGWRRVEGKDYCMKHPEGVPALR